jgi:uncharacterized repeat protein (TIGR02543 family)
MSYHFNVEVFNFIVISALKNNYYRMKNPLLSRKNALFHFCFFIAFFVNLCQINAQSLWKQGAGGAWGTATNWTPNGVPGGVGAIVDFTNNPSAQANISLGGTRTIGVMNLGHQEAQFLHTFSNDTLIFDHTSGKAAFNLTTSRSKENQHIFSGCIQLKDDLVIDINGEGGLMVFQKNIIGSGGNHTLTIKGNSTYNTGSKPMYTFQGKGNSFHKLVLDGKLSYNINRHTLKDTLNQIYHSELVFGSERSDFLADAITLRNGGTFRGGLDGYFYMSYNHGITLGQAGGGFIGPGDNRHFIVNTVITGDGPFVTYGGKSTIRLNEPNTYTGATIVNGGIVVLGRNASLPASTMLMIFTGGKVNPNGKTGTVSTLFLDGVQKAAGTWGSSFSNATNKNDTYFTGSGVINVTSATPPSTFMVSFESGGVQKPTSGSMPATQSKLFGTPLTLPDNTGNLTRTGYVFDGWNTKEDGTGTSYAAGASYDVNANLRLYPKWKIFTDVPVVNANYDFTIYPTITSDMIYFSDLPEYSCIEMIDISGRLLFVKNTSEVAGGISLQFLENGLYFIRVKQGQNFVHSLKIIKK